jgi:hypothetical protein
MDPFVAGLSALCTLHAPQAPTNIRLGTFKDFFTLQLGNSTNLLYVCGIRSVKRFRLIDL